MKKNKKTILTYIDDSDKYEFSYWKCTFDQYITLVKNSKKDIYGIVLKSIPDFKYDGNKIIEPKEWEALKEFTTHRINQLIKRALSENASSIKTNIQQKQTGSSIILKYYGKNLYKMISTGMIN